MLELLAHARRLGVSVHVAHLPAPFRGLYDGEHQRVIYDFDLTPAERRTVLAHELGHAYHDHRCRDDADAERQADVYAAHLLVDPLRLAQLEQLNPDPEHLAEELNVTADVIHTYRKYCITQLSGVTYVRSRMGVGQWTARFAHA